MLETLISIDKKLNRRNLAKQYGTFTDAIPDIVTLAGRRKRGGHVIKVLASTGATTVNTLLPGLLAEIRKQHVQIAIQIKLVNPDSPLRSLMPAHWSAETPISITRLRSAAAAGMEVKCSRYDYVPCLRGVLIDNIHLFAGFFTWDSAQPASLSGAEQPHFYLHRDTANEYLFQLWDGWFSQAPSVRILPDNSSAGAA